MGARLQEGPTSAAPTAEVGDRQAARAARPGRQARVALAGPRAREDLRRAQRVQAGPSMSRRGPVATWR